MLRQQAGKRSSVNIGGVAHSIELPGILDGNTVRHTPMARHAVTFKGGSDAPVHRWFRLTPSFGPELVRDMLSYLEADVRHHVLDPFSGAGTTAIECQLSGRKATGIEINPLLQFVSATSLNWRIDTQSLRKSVRRVSRRVCSILIGRLRSDFATSATFQSLVPKIRNRQRWWNDDVLVDLVALKSAILEEPDLAIRSAFRMALAGCLVPDLTNVVLSRLQLHFIDKPSHSIDVLGAFQAHVGRIIDDLISLAPRRLSQTALIKLDDSKSPSAFQGPYDRVVTSPPYPNRYSYVWNTRPHLYMLDMIGDHSEATEIDKKTIGGTWGSATSMHARGVTLPIHPVVAEVVGPTVQSIRNVDNLMANYVMAYFNDMACHLLSLAPHLARRAQVAYVVGCSRVKSIFVETDVMLADIIRAIDIGAVDVRVHRIRKRNSGKNLHESIVYATF